MLAEKSAELCNRVSLAAAWQQADTLLLYYPLPDEVDVRLLVAAAYRAGKRVLLPVCVGEELELRLYEGEASLAQGAFGIMEPQGTLFPVSDYAEIQFVAVPGMAFDAAGHRLGRGKGYYDRLLPQLPGAHLMGICYDFQLLPGIPTEPHDCMVHEVVATLPA